MSETKKPNNFPREGDHNTITRDDLKQLEAHRARLNENLDYTIGGMRETVVHTNFETARNYALNTGHKRMNAVSEKVKTDHVFAANKGRSKAQFQAANDTGKTYAEKRREAIKNAQAKKPERSR